MPLATYCQLWARFVEAERSEPYEPISVSHVTLMASIANRLGLDPSGRVKLPMQEKADPQPNPWDLPASTLVARCS
jgi:phage terminase small subunit